MTGLYRFPRNGTEAFLIDDADGMLNGQPWFFEIIDDVIYFVADHELYGRELWRSDGTTAGTFVITDISPFGGNSHPAELVQLGDTLLFIATDDFAGTELWTIDMPQDTVEFDGATYLVREDGTLEGDEIIVQRKGSLAGALEFTVSYVEDSARAVGTIVNADFDAASQSYVFLPGQESLVIAPPMIVNDSFHESEIADLDGDVDAADCQLFFSYKPHWPNPWSRGYDFNADGFNDGSDFNIWNENRFRSPPAAPTGPAREPRAPLVHGAIAVPQAPVIMGPPLACASRPVDMASDIMMTGDVEWVGRELPLPSSFRDRLPHSDRQTARYPTDLQVESVDAALSNLGFLAFEDEVDGAHESLI